MDVLLLTNSYIITTHDILIYPFILLKNLCCFNSMWITWESFVQAILWLLGAVLVDQMSTLKSHSRNKMEGHK
uniref:Uncharacterized protein n=1 Tax=Anguilla anguilla TaxID=7936 RepID=A0A0E9XES1_ANGAN